MNSAEYFKKFSQELGNISNEKLITAFNKEVGINAWGTARASYLAAIRNEFDKRRLDYSQIGDQNSLSLRSKVKLQENKLVIITLI